MERKAYLDRMLGCLAPQMRGEVEHIILSDYGDMTLGKKMNHLYQMVSGKYVTVVNDDDLVPANYIDIILKAAESDKDILLGKILSGWVNSRTTLEAFLKSDANQTYHRYENVIPAKTELVVPIAVWDESREMTYKQDSNLSASVGEAAKSVHDTETILYYHMRQTKLRVT
jgi:GT2 family glycosyltransferase